MKKANPKKSGARTKECPGCGAKVGVSIKECNYCDHMFTAKSALTTQDNKTAVEEATAIRERFMFEPEKEEDGSKIITAILGRRPRTGIAHNAGTISKSYIFRPEKGALDSKYDNEYLIKYKDLSFRNCEWLTANDVDAMSVRSKTALSRYLTKIDRGDPSAQEDGEIDPTWMEVEKVLDMREEDVAENVDGNFDASASTSSSDAIRDQKADAVDEADGDANEDADEDADPMQTTSLASRASFASQISVDDDDAADDSSSCDEDGERKVKTATQIFQHETRCRKLLERIWDDPYAASFVDPVDTNFFEDYHDVVDEPMSLSEVKDRLEAGDYRRYNQHVRFMNDLRLIWKNCKNYNLYKSQIWHSAHTLSMMCERLFQSWVLSYQDGGVELKDPMGQPWETTCRTCQTEGGDDEVILCDHCDAPFHIYCLTPKMEKVPEGSWMCTRCVKFFAKCERNNKMGIKVLTATAEDEARVAAENAGIRKVIQVRKKKYLVKWRGLSYKDCTWELPKDIGEDAVILEFHALNDAPPDEPPLTRAELDAELRKDRAKPLDLVRQQGNHYNAAWDVEAEVYAQIRALHFLKWDQQPPEALLKECGPECFAYSYGRRTNMILPAKLTNTIDSVRSSVSEIDVSVKEAKKVEGVEAEYDVPSYCDFGMETKLESNAAKNAPELDWCRDKAEVAEQLGVMVNTVCRHQTVGTTRPMMPVYTSRPSLPRYDRCTSEVEYRMPKGNNKLGIRIANYYGRAVVLGLHKWGPDRARNHPLGSSLKNGDILTAINGISVVELPFSCVLRLLSSTNTPYIYLRFLRTLDRSGPEGAKDREALRARQNANADPSSTSESQLVETEDGGENADLDQSDDPELDVVQRYLNRKRPTKSNFRLPPMRSLYEGVFPTDEGKWDAMFYVYSADEKRGGSRDGYGAYQYVGSFSREEKAAQKRDKLMREYMADESGNKIGDILESKLNFESDGETVLKIHGARHRIVTAEREERERMLRDIASRDAIFAEETSNGDVLSAPTKVSSAESGDSDQMEVDSDAVEADAEAAATELKSEVKSEVDNESKDGMNNVDNDDICSLDSRDSDTENVLSSGESSSDDTDSSDGSWDEDDAGVWRPKKDIVTEIDGPSSRLLRAVNEVDMPPYKSDWEKYILEDFLIKDKDDENDRRKPGILPTPKSATTNAKEVDQLDMKTGEIINTWRSVTDAARAVGCSTTLVHEALSGKKESAGGFHWVESKRAEEAAVQEMLKLLDAEEREEKAAEGDNDGEGEGEEVGADGIKRRRRKDMSWTKNLYKKSKEYKMPGNKLRDYQLDGINWLLRCWYQKKSSILADEMGLGKTVQIVTFLEHLFEVEHLRGPFLVCVPLSTIGHWRREFENWSNMVVNVYHDTGGGRDMRDIIREFEWYYKGRSRRLLKFQTLICTYDDLIRDYEELAEIPWRAVVVDEAHRLRNVNSKLLECIRAVLARGLSAYGYQHRVLLTGTPLQNNTNELWSLLNFIEPAKFPDSDKFQMRFGNIQTQDQVVSLQKRLAPHLLRRVKEDVAKDIPNKEETIIDVELTTIQKQYYRAIFEHNHGFLMQQMKGHMPKLMNIQMELRKCCNHPYLVNGVEEMEENALDAKLHAEAAEVEANADAASTGLTSFQLRERKMVKKKAEAKEYTRRRMEENIIPTSGKMVLLDKLLPKLRKEGHKVLIFSQMVRMLDMIGEYCEYREYPNERLDGRVSGNDRQKGIDRFNKNEDSFIFLLSTRAGGVGINLTAADTVIIFDSDWNPQNDVQAMARCHRIGQKKQVTIYRLITRRSFEAEMFDRASRKLGLEHAVLGTRKFTDPSADGADANDDKKIDAKEMEQLLKEGAYAVLLDDEAGDQDMKEFCEQDIDKILANRSHVHVTEGGQKTESWLNKKKKNRARKTKFVGANADDVDVNDPDFWKKVLPDLVTPDALVERFDAIDTNPKFDKKKFIKDLTHMMNGMLDLNTRGTLPNRERTICQDLLLRFSLNEQIFAEKERQKANEWLTLMEGTRNRRSRMDLGGQESGIYNGDHDGAVYGDLESDSDGISSGAERGDSDDSNAKSRKRRRGGGRGPDRKPRKGGGPGSRGGKGGYSKKKGDGSEDENDSNEPPKKRRRRKKDLDPNAPPKERKKRGPNKKKKVDDGEEVEPKSNGPKRSKFQQQKQSDYVFSDESDDEIQKVLKQSALEGMGHGGSGSAMDTEDVSGDPYSAGVEYL